MMQYIAAHMSAWLKMTFDADVNGARGAIFI